jgi:hypothetical protein
MLVLSRSYKSTKVRWPVVALCNENLSFG